MDLRLRQKWISDVEKYTEYRTAITSCYYQNVSKVFERRKCHDVATSPLLQPSDLITELYDIASQAKVILDSILIEMFDSLNFEVNVFDDNVLLNDFLATNEILEDGSCNSLDPYDIYSYNYLITMPLKPKDSTFNKAIDEYHSRANINRVIDVVRSSVICNSEENLAFVLDALYRNAGRPSEETGSARYDIVSCKNRFKHPTFTGYRDLLLTVRVEVPAQNIKFSAAVPRSTAASAATASSMALAEQGEVERQCERDAKPSFVFYCEIQLHLLSLFIFETRTCGNISRAYYEKYRGFFVVPECFHDGDGDGDSAEVVDVNDTGNELQLGLSASPSPEKTGQSLSLVVDEPESEPGSPLRPKRVKKALNLKLYEYRSAILRKMAQVANDVTQLEALIGSFLTGTARRNRDLDRLRAYRDLLQVTGEEDLCEEVQVYIIRYLKEFYYASVKEFRAAGGGAKAGADGCVSMSARSHVLLVETALEISRQAKHYKSCRRYAEALPLCLEALELCEKLHGRDHPITAKELTDLGTLFYCQGRFADATPIFERAWGIRQAVLGAAHVETLSVLVFYADSLYDNGQLQEALAQFEQLVLVQMQSLGEDAPDVSTTIIKMADVHRDLGDVSRAVELELQALGKRLSFFGADHPVSAESLSNLGILSDMQGLHVAAMDYHQRALEIRAAALGESAAATGESCAAVAQLCLVLKRDIDSVALPHAERAVDVLTRWYVEAYPFGYKLGAAATPAPSVVPSRAVTARPASTITSAPKGCGGHPLLASALHVYAEVLLALERLTEAKSVVDRALQMRKEVCGGKSSAVMQSVSTHGVIVAMLKRAHRQSTTTEGSRPSSPQSLAAAAAAAGGGPMPMVDTAEPAVYDVKKESNITFINVEHSPDTVSHDLDHPDDIVIPYVQLDHHANQEHISLCDADDCREAGAYDRAIPLYKAVVESLRTSFGPFHPTLGVAHTHLGLCYEDMEHFVDAEAEFRHALGIAQAAYCGRDFEGSCAGSIFNYCQVETPTSRVDAATAADPVEFSLALPERVHSTVAGALVNVANACLLQKKYNEAGPLFCEAFRVQVLLLTEAGAAVVFEPELEESFSPDHEPLTQPLVEKPEVSSLVVDGGSADDGGDGDGDDVEVAAPAATGLVLKDDPLLTDAELCMFVRTGCSELVVLQYALAQCMYGKGRPDSAYRLVELVLGNRLTILREMHSEQLAAEGLAPIEGNTRPTTGAGAETRPATGAETRPVTGEAAAAGPGPVVNLKADPDYTAALNLKFLLLIELDQWETAQTLGSEVVKLREVLCGVSHPAYAVALNNLGVLQYSKRDFAKAGVLLDTSLDVRERTLGVSAEDSLMAMNNLATILAEQSSETAATAKTVRDSMQKITAFKVTYVAKPPTAVS